MNKMIDAVITWVDGDDPHHRSMRNHYLEKIGQPQAVQSNAAQETRFNSSGEIYYAIASILKYAEFINTIYIVTDQQTPPELKIFDQLGYITSGKIKVVDHAEIFSGYEEYLPTFNSLSIETMLWRIENLSDYFIYLNDDFFFNKEAEENLFITPDDRVKIYGTPHYNINILLKHNFRKLKNRLLKHEPLPASYKVAQVNSSRLIGHNSYVELGHRPHIIRKATLENYFKDNDDILRKQIQYKFRSINQFLPVGLANHIEIKQGTGIILPELDLIYAKPGKISKVQAQMEKLASNEVQFGCIQSLDMMEPILQQYIHQMLERKFPIQDIPTRKADNTIC